MVSLLSDFLGEARGEAHEEGVDLFGPEGLVFGVWGVRFGVWCLVFGVWVLGLGV